MRTVLLFLIFLMSLPGCAMVSRKIHPELSYREHPRVQVTYFDSWWELQRHCFEQHHHIPHIYTSCVLVPHNPDEVCNIYVLKGSKYNLAHDLMHCHGYADTMLPWMAQKVGE